MFNYITWADDTHAKSTAILVFYKMLKMINCLIFDYHLKQANVWIFCYTFQY